MNKNMKLNEVQLTALIPLWGRAKYSEANPEVLKDDLSIKVLKNITDQYGYTGEKFNEYGGLCYIVRARRFDDEVLSFLESRSKATIVNLGCGLDTGFERLGSGKDIKWYNLDLEDMIQFRKSIINCDDSREMCISKSILNYTWFDDIEYDNSSDVLFLAGGLFHFFHKEDIMKLLTIMAEKVPGSTVLFDINSKEGTRISNKMFKKLNKKTMMYFCIDKAEELNDISQHIKKVKISNFWSGIKIKDTWLPETKAVIKSCFEEEFSKVVRIEYK